ncbi:MAG: LON peptidase substrate-binding domain-containing protein [Armatimonadetes bacterium]|nr:LON peptidase substrate-binding domain-containing protein [Armatimonadota bacterium]
MANRLEEMPLFPLHAVLFPHSQMHLHVFERRYREMIRHCLEYDTPFGIVLIRSGSEVGAAADPYLVGTAVRIVRAQEFGDGRMDIVVQGERRFRIRELDETRPYLVGKVEPLVESEALTQETKELFTQAKNIFKLFVEQVLRRQEVSIDISLPGDDPVSLSFAIASLLPLENLEKQRLLETTSTSERVEDLLPRLQEQLLSSGEEQSYYRVRASDLASLFLPN